MGTSKIRGKFIYVNVSICLGERYSDIKSIIVNRELSEKFPFRDDDEKDGDIQGCEDIFSVVNTKISLT